MVKRIEYVVLCGRITGGDGEPFETEYGFDGTRFTHKPDAIKHGLKVRGSDDFNIGVMEDGKLVRLDWMNAIVEDDPAALAKIHRRIFGEEIDGK